MGDDRILTFARRILRAMMTVNLLATAIFVIAAPASFVFADVLSAHLLAKYGPKLDVAGGLLALRLLVVMTVPCGIAIHAVFRNLLRIVDTVREGDPFTAVNATRLRAIGWALLAIQLCDLLLGGFTAWFALLHIQFSTWSPSFGGWIAVLMAFVLAHVFRRGAEMRDDLAMTV
ncbi:DUF2975 domain-containing protein [Sphingomonas sp. RB3P16]|uniref:DUF2975 domain-containing protein n=1 Tax=Parasphingomonas frigoris TaxID=3096163 RepID=UPI002FC695E4